MTLFHITEAWGAFEKRLALLVANSKGWKEDPPLRYALQGDTQPLATELRRLGFEVITLIDQRPAALRKVLTQLHQRFQKDRSITTFLFYYSGHADTKRLHMGERSAEDFSYKEFAGRFRNLPIKRRIAIFDACFSGEVIRHFGSLHRYKQLLREGRTKGVKQASSINISQLAYPNQGEEEGFRIIASSLQLSWELNRYRASVFTYHFLRGLRGEADLDQDGKISVDELFDYTSRAVQRITHQKPQQLVVTQREQPYAIAPAYRSRVRIGAHVIGDLQISVANFTWSYTKAQRAPVTVAAIDGKATIQLKRGKRCFQQELQLPKGGEIPLRRDWKDTPCEDRTALRPKGNTLLLPAQVELVRDVFEPNIQIGLWGGMTSQGQGLFTTLKPALGLDLRWRWLQGGLQLSQSLAGERVFSLTRLLVHVAAGYPLWLHTRPFHGEFWLGGFLQGGLVWQHFPEGAGNFNLNASAGVLLSATWWLEGWGLRLHTALGGDYLPTLGGAGFSLYWNLGLAIVWGR